MLTPWLKFEIPTLSHNPREGWGHPEDSRSRNLLKFSSPDHGNPGDFRITLTPCRGACNAFRKPSVCTSSLQLSTPRPLVGRATLPRPVPANARTFPRMVWVLRLRIRGHARAHSPAYQRAGTKQVVDCPADVKAKQRARVAPGRRRAVLGAAILRFQRLERSQADRKTPLHPSQSRPKGSGRASGRLGVEQLSPLRHRSRFPGRNRIPMDRTEAGTDGDLPADEQKENMRQEV